MSRRSGLSLPLSAAISLRSWGIGECRDVVPVAEWARGAQQAVLQLLPMMELPPGETSPYAALSSFAIDPVFIAVPDVPDFDAAGGELAFESPDRLDLEALRQTSQVRREEVQRQKQRWLRRAWDRFRHVELARATPRARAFDAWCAQEAWWLDEYAAFRALMHTFGDTPWWDWPAPWTAPSGDQMQQVAADHAEEVGFRKYLQWIVAAQWHRARTQVFPLRLYGDLPFMVAANSAEVWARRSLFRLDVTVGAPPDAFASEGQDWGMPAWHWPALEASGFAWTRQRATRLAALFDGLRIDHVVGLYRTWMVPRDRTQPAGFAPVDPHDQQRIGEAFVTAIRECGAEVYAEDLGTVPDAVRASMAALEVPGLKVMRWERRWNEDGQPPIPPDAYPMHAVATTGTHDIPPLGATMTPAEVSHEIERLQQSAAMLTLVPLQDAFAWPDRINVPGVVDAHNWAWRVPRPVDTWAQWPDAVQAQQRLADATRRAGRVAPGIG
jgi:4-alpha-glucanotransferase